MNTDTKPQQHLNQQPPIYVKILNNGFWLILFLISCFLSVALFTYNKMDPGWTHASPLNYISNLGGRAGAYIADLLYFIFGLSSWWMILFLFLLVITYYKTLRYFFRLDLNKQTSLFHIIFKYTGFLFLFISSCGVEYLRMHRLGAILPGTSGGVLGEIVGATADYFLGPTFATILLLVLMAIGFSLFIEKNWIDIVENVGLFVERIYFLGKQIYITRQDKQIGMQANIEREKRTTQNMALTQDLPEIHIEPQVTTIEQSPRVEQEKQTILFNDLQDGLLPPLSLLDPIPPSDNPISKDVLEYTSRLIERKLDEFGVKVHVVAAYPGPVVTRYEIKPEVGVKGSTIVNLSRDLARSLALISIRVIETIPGKEYMALELPNAKRQTVYLNEVLSSQVYSAAKSTLTIALGKDISGQPVIADLSKMPHLLIAGTTGSGKSVGINATILSLIYKSDPSQVKLILIDPKMLELSIYEGIPHLLAPVVTDMSQAGHALTWAVAEMERRYRLMSKLGVRNLSGYNNRINDAQKKGEPLTNPFSLTPEEPELLETLPQIVIIIDEFADLIMTVGKKVEELIARIAQKARASGIHLILATQRPSVDVITGLIKANFPSRIAFQVSSKTDSRTILDQMGAESLLGLGDMLFLPPGVGLPQRVHGAFVSDDEIHRVVSFLKEHHEVQYIEGILDNPNETDTVTNGLLGEPQEIKDELYDQAVQIILQNKRASISLVQRHLRIGYNRAARLLEKMEKEGIVSPMKSNGNRDILVPTE